MTLPPLDQLKKLQAEATPGPWTVEEDRWEEVIVANDVGHRMEWGEQVRFVFDAGKPEADPQLAALAPPLLAEVIRLREALEDLLDEIKFIALADMFKPQTEVQQTAITLTLALCDDLIRILEGKK